ncbi:hypothetical protein BGZ57DRAFT_1017541 [Hyaloscypha finlandica]|nr:hypothetical protein BGZ57DRAFT_1017541 [Hyaloscypha finlandica]
MKALKRLGKRKAFFWRDWSIEHVFRGITVLYENKAKTEFICDVHGLGGNAFDTWTVSNGGSMWPRDFLPSPKNFPNSRIMTFGYDSDLTDSTTLLTMESCAQSLLRRVNEARNRPLLLVCHSLGGLITRKRRLSGGGVRREWVDVLKSFNNDGLWDRLKYFKLKPCPPFQCFAEGEVTLINRLQKKREPARMLDGTDHRTIAKFDSGATGPFVSVSKGLRDILEEIAHRNASNPARGSPLFGHPRFLAHAFPREEGKYWYVGSGFPAAQQKQLQHRPFFGRREELEEFKSIAATLSGLPRLTAIKGIAGIGKTELLLQFILSEKSKRNVFYLKPGVFKTVSDAIVDISTQIGIDIVRTAEHRESWRRVSPSERADAFYTWIGDPCNKDLLLVIDDLEALGESAMQTIREWPVWHIVISTRDSDLGKDDEDILKFRLERLGDNDVISILENRRNLLGQQDATLFRQRDHESLAPLVHGHPMAARAIIRFTLNRLATFDNPGKEFLDMFTCKDFERRKAFLQFKTDGSSLWEAFDSSLKRLQNHDKGGQALKLFQLLSYLQSDHDCIDDFCKLPKQWPKNPAQGLPDVSIVESGYDLISEWLAKLRSISVYLRASPRCKSLDIHPLILDYALLCIGNGDRTRIAKQVFQLLSRLEFEGTDIESKIRPHVLHCIKLCQKLGVFLDSVKRFNSQSDSEDPFLDSAEIADFPVQNITQEFTARLAETKKELKKSPGSINRVAAIEKIVRCIVRYKQLRRASKEDGNVLLSSDPEFVGSVQEFCSLVRSTSPISKLPKELEQFTEVLRPPTVTEIKGIVALSE